MFQIDIYEPTASGHHLVLYARNLIREVIKRGWHFRLVTTASSKNHSAFGILESEYGKNLNILTMPEIAYPSAHPSKPRLLRYQYLQYRAFKNTFRRCGNSGRPDLIFVISLDHFDKMLATLGSPFADTPFAGFLMNPKYHPLGGQFADSKTRWLGRMIPYRILKIPTLVALFTVNPVFADNAKSAKIKKAEKVHYVPDVGSLSGSASRKEAREKLGILSDDIVILVYGSRTRRKGIPELLKAMCSPVCPANIILMMAGEQNEDSLRLERNKEYQLLSLQKRIREVHGFLDESREYSSFRASDIVWLGYKNFDGMSGVLLQACAMALPIIACQNGVIGWMTSKHSLGEIVDIGNPEQVAAAISKLARNPGQRNIYGNNGKMLALNHTPDHFAESICDVLSSEDPDL